jgi:hypothetical protein
MDKAVLRADCCRNKLTRWKFISSVTWSPWLTEAVFRARLLETMSLNPHHSASKFKSWKQKQASDYRLFYRLFLRFRESEALRLLTASCPFFNVVSTLAVSH